MSSSKKTESGATKSRARKTEARPPFTLWGVEVPAGKQAVIELPLPRLYTYGAMAMPVQVFHGRRPGPNIFVCAALHGDELNGMEIIRRLVVQLKPRDMAGTVIAVPVVNVYGFLQQSRYLPDRRDLNRCFPGSQKGSLGSRLARTFLNEIVTPCQYGIDLHTAAMNRTNLPQLRIDCADVETRALAEAFGAPVIVDASTRDGSLREAAVAQGVRMLLYEAGEPLRFSTEAIDVGLQGCLRVLHTLGIQSGAPEQDSAPPLLVTQTSWMRARQSGILCLTVKLGQEVAKGQALGSISDTLGAHRAMVRAGADGLIIGFANNPLVHRGDAIVHIGMLT
ncbi:MAG: succinylglutamate desuccinylase/aspartoacylase family protein [Candidatus Hydrogenedentes bacterium]|nr:succinylglutamate desuccinylase/aspartoacylase family protein [Candidatus Hydrogenedentota bacterium]